MLFMTIFTGLISTGVGIFFLALSFYGWENTSVFLAPDEERSMKVMLISIATIGTVLLADGALTLFNLIG